jgi:hypothetical protein
MNASMLLKLIGLLVLLVLFIKFMLIAFFKQLFFFIDLKKRGIPIEGIIVDIKEIKDSDNLTLYQKVIEFTTLDNKKCRYTSDDATMYEPDLGKKVKLIYDPHNVDHILINPRSTFTWIVVKILFIILVFAFVFYGILYAKQD